MPLPWPLLSKAATGCCRWASSVRRPASVGGLPLLRGSVGPMWGLRAFDPFLPSLSGPRLAESLPGAYCFSSQWEPVTPRGLSLPARRPRASCQPWARTWGASFPGCWRRDVDTGLAWPVTLFAQQVASRGLAGAEPLGRRRGRGWSSCEAQNFKLWAFFSRSTRPGPGHHSSLVGAHTGTHTAHLPGGSLGVWPGPLGSSAQASGPEWDGRGCPAAEPGLQASQRRGQVPDTAAPGEPLALPPDPANSSLPPAPPGLPYLPGERPTPSPGPAQMSSLPPSHRPLSPGVDPVRTAGHVALGGGISPAHLHGRQLVPTVRA